MNGNPFHSHKLGGAEDDGVSGKITTEINKNSTNTEVPGAKAVYEHVRETVYYAVTSSYQYTDREIASALIEANEYTNIAGDTVLTTAYQYTDKEVSGKADKAEFTNLIPTDGIKNGLYITDENAVNIYDGKDWRNLSKEISNSFEISGKLDEIIPTLYAVSSFVNEKLENIDIPEIPASNLSFVDTFPSIGNTDTLYISKITKEAGFYTDNGLQKINIDIDIVDTLTETTPNEQIPCAGAVREYVNGRVEKISEEFNAEISGKTELVIGDIPSNRCGKYIIYR